MASSFGHLTDYFGAEGAVLMLVASDSGTGRRVTNLWNGASEQGGELANPVCTYRVRARGTVSFTLGHAWNGANGKYFLVEVEFGTGADAEPVLILRGQANEGANAINSYSVSFAVSPDHVAQDPYGAVSGGGELVACTTVATCDPVVPYEDNRPCASDVVHGRVAVTAETAAYGGEAKPTAAGQFVDAGVPKAERDVDFTTYAFTAERSL